VIRRWRWRAWCWRSEVPTRTDPRQWQYLISVG